MLRRVCSSAAVCSVSLSRSASLISSTCSPARCCFLAPQSSLGVSAVVLRGLLAPRPRSPQGRMCTPRLTHCPSDGFSDRCACMLSTCCIVACALSYALYPLKLKLNQCAAPSLRIPLSHTTMDYSRSCLVGGSGLLTNFLPLVATCTGFCPRLLPHQRCTGCCPTSGGGYVAFVSVAFISSQQWENNLLLVLHVLVLF